MKKQIFLLLIVLALFSSCKKEDTSTKNKVAVLLPTSENILRWNLDKEYLVEALGNNNIDVVLKLANDETGAATQIEQIKEALNQGIKNFVITPIDYNAINNSGVFNDKEDLNIVCHDRMLYNNALVNYYSTCHGYEVGALQGKFLVQMSGASPSNPKTLEMLAGPTSDNNSILFFNGAYDVLKPYIDNGSITIRSNKKTYNDVALSAWSSNDAKTEILSRLNGFYTTGETPNLILAPNDIVASGVIEALEQFNPTLTTYPLITGQDNTDAAVQLIKNHKLSMTVDKSIRDMCYNTANVINSLMKGHTPATSYSFDNGVKNVPLVKSSPKVITIDDVK